MPATILTTKVCIPPDSLHGFVDWQAKLNAAIANFPGFVSLEILSPQAPHYPEWMIVQRFADAASLRAWNASKDKKLLTDLLMEIVHDKKDIQEVSSTIDTIQGGVTEVFVTEVNPHQDKAYREWIAKIHHAEAKFPGFRGVYVQSPSAAQGKNWITLLQFDTPQNLDRWLSSKERQEVLKESESMITFIESHRVISPFAGWFSSIAKKGTMPPLWKQTMLILLVLFPIVMIELKYLSPITNPLGPSLSTFIGNAISVSLISWPMMPIAIRFLRWWLAPEGNELGKNLLGTGIVLTLYLIEIILFWNLL